MQTTDDVLKERGNSYGDFYRGIELETAIVEAIKERYKLERKKDMDPVYAMFISKIAMKLSRIAVTPDHLDSWVDIAGYARLVELHLKGKENA